MSTIKVYSPREAELHLTLPHDHANSIHSTSPFMYKLDEEFDFVEVFPFGDRAQPQVGLDPNFVTALFWAVTRTKQIINRATRGVVPAVAVNAMIPEALFENLGMRKPKLVILLERTDINPLRCFGDQATLIQIVKGLQQLGREAIDWIVEAKWRSQLMGPARSLWDWEDPRTLEPLSHLLGYHRLVAPAPGGSPASILSNFSAPSSPTDSITSIPPNSPTFVADTFLLVETPFNSPTSTTSDRSIAGSASPTYSPVVATLPFGAGETVKVTPQEEEVEMLLQLVLHPTASRYAQRYPLANFFGHSPLIENGYVESESDDAMEVDEE